MDLATDSLRMTAVIAGECREIVAMVLRLTQQARSLIVAMS
ncbi:hypothetical protein ABZX90_01880 [Streptomyces sp. NPDC002935]